ncbi:hypothetical protein ACFOZ5_11710 [Marinobacter lacisalsi]|uniref:Uncharacterized protein n=1 Tax=Marinobacter lacisalsi TaxID=475979 RepID=A0ABV8QHP8_9GAMM
MRSKNDDRRIQRFMGWSALILFTPWVLSACLKGVQAYQSGLLDNSNLLLVLIGLIGVAFGALVLWVIPTWNASHSGR